MLLIFVPHIILDIRMHSCCYYAAITSLMCRVAFVRPCRIRITPKSWNRKWPQVKLRSELTISEQCSENISHKHALTYKNKDRHYEWAHLFSFYRTMWEHCTIVRLFHTVRGLYNRLLGGCTVPYMLYPHRHLATANPDCKNSANYSKDRHLCPECDD